MTRKAATLDNKLKNRKTLLQQPTEQRGIARLLHGDTKISFGERFKIRQQLDPCAAYK